MSNQYGSSTDHVSRRQLLALAGGIAAVATVGPQSSAAQQEVAATAAPATPSPEPILPEFPIPATLAADASPLFRTVTDALVTSMRAALVPGVAIGILVGDREEHATFGVASLSSMNPVTPDTLFQIGSISKTITATAIWHLIDEGVLDLDAPLRTYIPDLTLMDEDVAARVTVGNLLDHTVGWYGDEGFDTGDNDDALARYIAERLPELPQIFPLGEYFSYNNAAFTVLGRLIEVATGATYNAAIHNLLLDPLGLEESFLDRNDVLQRPYADGHVALYINGFASVAVQTPLWIPRSVDSAGGFWSTTRDLLRYARFHMHGGTVAGSANVVHSESLAQMQEPAIDVPGTSVQMGRDWFVQNVDGIHAAYHGGDTLGQHADLFMIPEHDFALVVLTNGQSGGINASTAALNAALAGIPALASLAGKIGLNPAFGVPTDTPTVDLTEAEAAEYVGRFADLGQTFTIVQTASGLEATLETIFQPGAWTATINPVPTPATPLTFLEPDMADMGGGRVPFLRDADGRVAWVALGLRLLPRVDDGA